MGGLVTGANECIDRWMNDLVEVVNEEVGIECG